MTTGTTGPIHIIRVAVTARLSEPTKQLSIGLYGCPEETIGRNAARVIAHGALLTPESEVIAQEDPRLCPSCLKGLTEEFDRAVVDVTERARMEREERQKALTAATTITAPPRNCENVKENAMSSPAGDTADE